MIKYSMLISHSYNLDNLSWSAPKINAVVDLVKAQVAVGTPVDGIGTECHLSIRTATTGGPL